MSKILVAMSGGVDSSAAALMLSGDGNEIAGATLVLRRGGDGCGDEADAAEAKRVCDSLGISHFTVDCTEEFDSRVMAEFARVYRSGATPNPCILCNSRVKFPAMISEAEKLGFDLVATGHYAKVMRDENSGRYLLLRSENREKDQSYVLYGLTQRELSHLVFPLGSALSKTEVRRLAETAGLENADRPDSQDICFIPDGDYASFIDRFTGIKEAPATFVLPDGRRAAAKKGISGYTVGQRKGLGVAFGVPKYVVGKNVVCNEVYLDDESGLFSTRVRLADMNYIPFETLEAPIRVTAKVRYSARETAATLTPTECGAMLEFDEPVRAAAPGQAAVCYDGDTVIGGGTVI